MGITCLILAFVVVGTLSNINGLFTTREEHRRREEERRRRRSPRSAGFYVVMLLLMCAGWAMRKYVEYAGIYDSVSTPPASKPQRAASASSVPAPSGPPRQGRPAHLRGKMPDGCELLPLQEAATLLGRPLVYESFTLLHNRDTEVHCVYAERLTRYPVKPRYEVKLWVVPSRSRDEDFTGMGALIPGAPGQMRSASMNGAGVDKGMRVAALSPHRLKLISMVALRDVKGDRAKREAEELAVARQIVTLLLERAAGLSPEEINRLAADRNQPRTGILSMLTSGYRDVVTEGFLPPERGWHAIYEPIYTLRARFGTRVKVVAFDEKKGLGGADPEELAQAVERTFEVGRGDTSPRRDGALVVVDLATHRAWFFFGPGAPPLTLGKGRPFPSEWNGRDLKGRGQGIATRLRALAAAYTRAYEKQGITGPPAEPRALSASGVPGP
ncbi:hypothetical protein ATI61_108221 [Archangium gephyra]|uniref:Uncharacterized protein n=2 Tax=Archangium gephyra TaxID=48 RepID=A0ABX9JWT1_9BACT|nr:TPM domain-containing protein [Archangium gephyra]REG28683.1 hypothetical protein ATI61_108221 [Archangium gephyra]